MTWNDLKHRLNEIPEERLNDKAIFVANEDIEEEIDNLEPVKSSTLNFISDPNYTNNPIIYVLTN